MDAPSVVTVTRMVSPEEAAALISTQTINRILDKNRVDSYANMMKRGQWTINNDAICVTSSGRLINGQHRLHAIIEAGIPILMTISYNMPDDAVIDRGKERSLPASLYMRNLIDERVATIPAAAIANRYLDIKYSNSRHSLSDEDKGKFLSSHADQIVKAIQISRTGKKGKTVCGRAGAQAALLAALINGVDEETIKRFAIAVNTGFINDAGESAAIVFRNWALEHPVTGVTASNELAAAAQTAIKDFCAKTPRKRAYRSFVNYYIEADDVA